LELVAMHLNIPYVHIWNVLHVDFSGATPACIFSWPHESTPEAVARNMEGLKLAGEILAPLVEVATPYAAKARLEIDWNDPSATTSKLAVISQTPREFDFPDTRWPTEFRYAGPFHDNKGRKKIPFPWDKLTGEPLVFASVGTLVNGLEYLYRTPFSAGSGKVGRYLIDDAEIDAATRQVTSKGQACGPCSYDEDRRFHGVVGRL
jgi:zeaxanthin glucosyltransferase